MAVELRRKARAFVLVSTKPGAEVGVAQRLLTYPEVVEAHVIPGEYDVLAVLEIRRDIVAPSSEEIMDFVINTVAKMDGVEDTHTIIPSHSWSKLPGAG